MNASGYNHNDEVNICILYSTGGQLNNRCLTGKVNKNWHNQLFSIIKFNNWTTTATVLGNSEEAYWAIAFCFLLWSRTRPTWYALVRPTNKLTLKRDQFLGMMTKEYRDQMNPVAAKAPDCLMLTFSTGRFMSPIPANTKPWLKK